MIRRFVNIGKGKPINIDDYLTFEALVDNSSVYLLGNSCEYCIDGDGNWIILDIASYAPILRAGQTISFRAELQPTKENGIGKFIPYGVFNLRGNCMSMLFSDNGKNSVSLEGKDYAFKGLFSISEGDAIKSVSDNFLPATILSIGCYQSMFTYCDFEKTPILPALILKQYCYEQMFFSCENLNYIKMLATDISPSSCLSGWVINVASTGTFVKNPDATWEVYGVSGIPNGWTVVMDGEEDNSNPNDNRPPESTSFGFPLYINTDLSTKEDDGTMACCWRESDQLTEGLVQWIYSNLVQGPVQGDIVPEELLAQNPIYIDGNRIIGIEENFGYIVLTPETHNLPIDTTFSSLSYEFEGFWDLLYTYIYY